MKKRIVLFLLIILSSLAINAQVVQKAVNVTEAGTLTKLLSDDEKKNVTNLTLTGLIDARDFKCMRDEILKLAVLDLKTASIQAYTGTDGPVSVQTTYKAKQIPESAFCKEKKIAKTSLIKITFPINLTETGANSFYLCTGLTGPLELPSSLNVIGENTFSSCTAISGELKIPSSVTLIGQSAFASCTGLTGKLTIPSGITTINYWSFYYCLGISSVEIPKNVISIDRLAFGYCNGLKEFNSYPVLPPTLGYTVFKGVDVTTCVLHVPIGSLDAYRNAPQWKDFVNIIDDLGNKTINMTEAGTLSGLLSDVEKQNITNLILTGPIDARDFKCMRDEIVKLAVLDLKAAMIQEYSGTGGTVPEQTTYKAKQIPDYAFCTKQSIGKKTLQKISFPDNLIEIGTHSLANCTGLVGPLVLPSMLEVLGEYTFNNCTGINGVLNLPPKVSLIGLSAFQGCSGFTGKLTLPSGIKIINDWTFFGCTGLSSVEIPKDVAKIGMLAFAQCTGLTYINCWADTPPGLGVTVFTGLSKSACALHVPKGRLSAYQKALQWMDFVKIIDDLGNRTINMTDAGALSWLLSDVEKQNITNLTLTGPIDARDFKCMRDEIVKLAVLDLKSVNIQEYTGAEGTVPEQTTYKAKQIPEFAFCTKVTKIGKESLTSITFPDNLTETGFASFYACHGLAGPLVLPSIMEVIGEYSFGICDGYTGELVIPASVISIGKSAFAGCAGFTGKLMIPSGIKKINSWTFYYCTGFSSVGIPNEVTSIDTLAFAYCKGLKDFSSYPEVPPTLGDSVFKKIDVSTCVLHVPKGTLSAYRTAPQWKDFVNINEDLIPTNINQNSVNDVQIGSVNNQIFVTGEQKIARIEVFDQQGRMMIDKKVKMSTYILPAVKSGNYIVRVHLLDGSVRVNRINID